MHDISRTCHSLPPWHYLTYVYSIHIRFGHQYYSKRTCAGRYTSEDRPPGTASVIAGAQNFTERDPIARWYGLQNFSRSHTQLMVRIKAVYSFCKTCILTQPQRWPLTSRRLILVEDLVNDIPTLNVRVFFRLLDLPHTRFTGNRVRRKFRLRRDSCVGHVCSLHLWRIFSDIF